METISNEVKESQNEEANEKVVENIIEEATEPQPTREIQQEEATQGTNQETKEKPKPKATAKKLARTVTVVEMVECNDCGKNWIPKSLKHSHPRNCKGQPSETLPANKKKNSYGSKLKEQMRKEIEEEMKSKYQNKQSEDVQYSEPIEVKTKATPKQTVIMKPPPYEVSHSIREPQQRQITASELVQQSYNEMKKLKRQEKAE